MVHLRTKRRLGFSRSLPGPYLGFYKCGAETKISEWKTKIPNIFLTCTQENLVYFILSFITLIVTLRILFMVLGPVVQKSVSLTLG